MSPITTLLPAACAAVAPSDANSSQGMVRSPIDFFMGAFPCLFDLPVRQLRKLPGRVHSPFVGSDGEVDALSLGIVILVNIAP
jgi:hypothetical protein